MRNVNIDLEFNPQMLLVGINYTTSTSNTYLYHTWEFYILAFRLVIEKPVKLWK